MQVTRETVRDYLHKTFKSYIKDPSSNDFQDGYLAFAIEMTKVFKISIPDKVTTKTPYEIT